MNVMRVFTSNGPGHHTPFVSACSQHDPIALALAFVLLCLFLFVCVFVVAVFVVACLSVFVRHLSVLWVKVMTLVG